MNPSPTPNIANRIEKAFRGVEFVASYPNVRIMPMEVMHETAFIGRSNSGKSTLLNGLCHQKHLAKSGKTPGLTKAINIFSLKPHHHLIDLPGYGYAKMSHGEALSVAKLLGDYLTRRQTLQSVVMIVDCRRGLMEVDVEVLSMLPPSIRLGVALSKVDKMNRAEINSATKDCIAALSASGHDFTECQVFPSSSLPQCKDGVAGVSHLRRWLWSLTPETIPTINSEEATHDSVQGEGEKPINDGEDAP